MNNSKVKVSVVLPVYQGEKYLREAIGSILNQTFTDFELLIIDDASTDQSVDVVKSFDDPRIHLIRNDSNLGLIGTLNIGLDLASGEYVARMDQDDISLPDRLSKQVAFMDSRPEVIASGTWAIDIDEAGNVIGERRMAVGRQLDYGFWWPCPIIHPSAIIRRSLLGDVRYSPDAGNSEDYDLWLRLKNNYTLDNIAECLILYRVHGTSISTTRAESQLRSVHRSLCANTGLSVSFEEFLELIGERQRLRPLRRAMLRRRLARAVGKPYVRYLREEMVRFTRWARAVLRFRLFGRASHATYPPAA